ncbi:hypothetical protein KQI84_15255 [bacterium]|nr:hypothetical protein [bacterium]
MMPTTPRTTAVLGAAILAAATLNASPLESIRDQQAEAAKIKQTEHVSRSVVVGLPTGYIVDSISTPVGAAAGAVSADPNDPNSFFVSVTTGWGYFRDIDIYRLELSPVGDPFNATWTPIATGTTSSAGDLSDGNDRLDNHFGSPSISMRADGTALVIDNDFGTTSGLSGVIGDAVIELTDITVDNDFRDISGSPEAALYATPIATTAGNFTGAQGDFDSAGNLYVVTTDGGGNGEVLRIADGATSQSVFFAGLDYGSGVAVDRNTDTVYFGDSNDAFTSGTLYKAVDINADGDALDAGETVLITDALAPISDVTFDAASGLLYVSTNSFFPEAYQVVAVDPATGVVTPFADFPKQFFQFVQGVAFDSSANTFEAGIARAGSKRLVVIDSENGVNVITPSDFSAVPDWREFSR